MLGRTAQRAEEEERHGEETDREEEKKWLIAVR